MDGCSKSSVYQPLTLSLRIRGCRRCDAHHALATVPTPQRTPSQLVRTRDPSAPAAWLAAHVRASPSPWRRGSSPRQGRPRRGRRPQWQRRKRKWCGEQPGRRSLRPRPAEREHGAHHARAGALQGAPRRRGATPRRTDASCAGECLRKGHASWVGGGHSSLSRASACRVHRAKGRGGITRTDSKLRAVTKPPG